MPLKLLTLQCSPAFTYVGGAAAGPFRNAFGKAKLFRSAKAASRQHYKFTKHAIVLLLI